MGTDTGTELDQTSDGETYCARHPDVESYLRCGRCGTPICPRCLVQTPVGARCPDCITVARVPTLDVGITHLLRAYGAAMVAGAIAGAAWAYFIQNVFAFGLFTAVIAGLGIGWVISEAISWASGRKRGPAMQGAAVYGAIIAYFARNIVLTDFTDTLIIRGDEMGYITAIAAAIFGASRLKFW